MWDHSSCTVSVWIQNISSPAKNMLLYRPEKDLTDPLSQKIDLHFLWLDLEIRLCLGSYSGLSPINTALIGFIIWHRAAEEGKRSVKEEIASLSQFPMVFLWVSWIWSLTHKSMRLDLAIATLYLAIGNCLQVPSRLKTSGSIKQQHKALWLDLMMAFLDRAMRNLHYLPYREKTRRRQGTFTISGWKAMPTQIRRFKQWIRICFEQIYHIQSIL